MMLNNNASYGTSFFYIDPFIILPKNSESPVPISISSLKVPRKGIYLHKKFIFKLLVENKDWVFINATRGSLSLNGKLSDFLYTLKTEGGSKDPNELYIATKTLRRLLDNIREEEKRCNTQC